MVLLAGANGGIGSAVARELGAAGARLHLGYRSDHTLVDRLTAELGEPTSAGQVDAADRSSVQGWLADGLRRHGRVDALVSCVGTALLPERFLDQDPSVWQLILSAELAAVLTLTHVVAPAIVDSGGGRIAILSSDSARAGAPGQAVSSAARGGVNAFCRSLARELARHAITVNTVCPGPVEGPALDGLLERDSGAVRAVLRAIPLRRASTTAEVAAAFRFLVLDRSASITGQALSVNGGLTMA